jgi:hypothetical protein
VSSRKLALACLAAAAVSCPAFSQQPTATKPGARATLPGTLFFSPGERERLDRLRANAGKPPEEARTEKPVINGIVRRSDGVVAVWIDSRRIDPVPGGYGDRLTGSAVGGEVASLKITASDSLAVTQPAPAAPNRKPGRRKAR